MLPTFAGMPEKKKRRKKYSPAVVKGQKNSGNDLLFLTRTDEVPSAQKGLTAVFGMGTGGTPSLWLPEKLCVFSCLKIP